ncbi:hypothetical protein SAMN05518855_1008179 [Paenibacillus sp. CF384]|nr:hypothetical protein SAMN05518855_1008179 [Paenibacillus sp. CF384]
MILELLRIVLLIAVLGAVFGYLIRTIYNEIGIANDNEWTIMLGIFIFIFVLYRNKLQFSGWYTGKGREKLPKRATQCLTIIAALLILAPVF